MRFTRWAPLCTVAALALAGCDGEPTVGQLTPLNTGELTGMVGKPVTVQVRVDDDKGKPLGDYPVRATPSTGSGSVSIAQTSSDPSGVATIQWTLGTTSGPQSLTVSAGAQSVTINASATPDAPASLALTAGAGQTGTVGDPLSTTPLVRVRDQYQNGVPGVDVAFRIVSGGGALAVISGRTNASGDVPVPWTLGPTPGEQAVAAEFTGLEPLRITANALPGAPARVSLVSGGGQTGTVGKALATPLVFEARDRFGNLAVAGRIELRGDGSASPSPATVGMDGRATATWTMGTRAGTQTMRAIAGTDSAAATGTANAGPPSTATRVRGDGQRGWAGGFLADSLTVLVKDEYDNPVPGAEVTFAVTGGGGSMSPATPVTRTNGEARAAWRLGTSVGGNAAEARVGSLTPITFAATATSGPPASMVTVSGDAQTARVATELPAPLLVRVRDEFGNSVQGATVELSTDYGGTISPRTAVTDTTGVTSFRWTLGRRAGSQQVSARSGAAVGYMSASATPGPAHHLTKAGGDLQAAGMNSPVSIRPSVWVMDAFENPLPGVPVTFSVTAGGGTVTGASQISGGNGGASVGSWILGPSPGRNALAASSPGLEGAEFTAEAINDVSYGIELVWGGPNAPSGAVQNAVAGAIGRWQSLIAGDQPGIVLTVSAGTCGSSHPTYFDKSVDDLFVLAEIVSIDGPGSTLAQAGPCYVRNSNGTTVVGLVRVDIADASLDANALTAVLTHEIGHVIGIGTLPGWGARLVGAGGPDPYFTGAQARARYSGAGGNAPNAVPVENMGGSGTRDGHWRESNMGRELMTGYLNTGANPLSAISIGALADMGYPVNFGAADGYSVSPAAPAREDEPQLELIDDILVIPIRVVPDPPAPGR